MNIVTEITPNPETLKFKVSKDLLKSNGIEFKRVEDAQENKFIEELFGIDGVKSIFVGSNFVSITKIYDMKSGRVFPRRFHCKRFDRDF